MVARPEPLPGSAVPGEGLPLVVAAALLGMGLILSGVVTAWVVPPDDGPAASANSGESPALAPVSRVQTGRPARSATPPTVPPIEPRAAAAETSRGSGACHPRWRVLYLPGEHAVPPEAANVIVSAAAWLAAHDDARAEVRGHTDDEGGTGDNLALSHRRARLVASALVARGIEERRITVQGFGEYTPMSGVEGVAAVNRRVDIVVAGVAECGEESP